MPRFDYKRCKRCGERDAAIGLLSHERLCQDCGEEIRLANNRELAAHTGPAFDHWRRRVAASVGATLDDRAPAA